MVRVHRSFGVVRLGYWVTELATGFTPSADTSGLTILGDPSSISLKLFHRPIRPIIPVIPTGLAERDAVFTTK